MVKPTKHTLGARFGINDNVVEAAVYGALNLKPENPRQRVKDYTLQTFWLLLQRGEGMLARQALAMQ